MLGNILFTAWHQCIIFSDQSEAGWLLVASCKWIHLVGKMSVSDCWDYFYLIKVVFLSFVVRYLLIHHKIPYDVTISQHSFNSRNLRQQFNNLLCTCCTCQVIFISYTYIVSEVCMCRYIELSWKGWKTVFFNCISDKFLLVFAVIYYYIIIELPVSFSVFNSAYLL